MPQMLIIAAHSRGEYKSCMMGRPIICGIVPKRPCNALRAVKLPNEGARQQPTTMHMVMICGQNHNGSLQGQPGYPS